METLSFSKIRFSDLQGLVSIREEVDDSKFEGWVGDELVTLLKEDEEFLEGLIRKHRKNIESYLEEEVKAKFIIPILNRIDFNLPGITDWYERSLRTEINGTILSGAVDYIY